MPGFSTEVPHSLGKEQATEKLNSFLDKIQEKFKDQISEMDGSWNNDVLSYSFTTYGITVNGTMAVADESVKLDGQLPFAAMMFKGKIMDSMRIALEKALV